MWLGSLRSFRATLGKKKKKLKKVCSGSVLLVTTGLVSWVLAGGLVVKNLPANAGDKGSDPCPGKIPWERKWQPTPVFLPEKSHGQRSLAGYSPRACQRRTWLNSFLTGQRRQLVASLREFPVSSVILQRGHSLALQSLRQLANSYLQTISFVPGTQRRSINQGHEEPVLKELPF